MGRFHLARCSASGCDSYTTAGFCPECSGRKVLVPSMVRQCAHPGCIAVTRGAWCAEHGD
jgi:hypothetical protein